MSRFEAWTLHVSNLLVGGTGLVYAWMVYLVKPADPYAVVNHPLAAAGAAPPHPGRAAAGLRRRPDLAAARLGGSGGGGCGESRRSGLSLAFLLVPMIVSGYLIQTAVDGDWRRIWVVVHLAASGLWLLGYLAHQATDYFRRTTSDQR